ncbi:MAG: hypothetical protein MI702_05055 [Chlorobiales bacterium]|nr:hypothetical protein [Chlorobiales bacterium]
MMEAQTLYQALPYDGRICLIESVLRWDTNSIVCSAASHLDERNPLREAGGLPVLAGLEYAAQACALHTVLCAGSTQANHMNTSALSVATVRGISWSVERLDVADDPLEITATPLLRQTDAVMYECAVTADGKELLSGRIGLMK